jgi:hypothetical protein
MSFLDDLPKNQTTEGMDTSTDAALARSAILFQSMRKLQSQINEENIRKNTQPTELDFKTAGNYQIPVVYGDAWVTGSVTDAVLLEGPCILWCCVTLCEATGDLLSSKFQDPVSLEDTYTASETTFADIILEDSTVVFREDGITVAKLIAEDGTENTDVDGLIKIYPFNRGSESPTAMPNTTAPDTVPQNSQAAYGLMPNWTTSHTMDELVFYLISVEYDAVKKVTKLPDVKVKLSNTMRQPGDCIWDYMRNDRYGAGIRDEEIYSDE